MASNINTTSIDENYPYAGVNQPSQGFRDNFRSIKNNITIASNEIGNLHIKRISLAGDATGQSGQLGSGTANPSAINVQLTPTGVTAGSYSTLNKKVDFTVDTKGRLLSVTSTDAPVRPVAGEASPLINASTGIGITTSIDFPVLTLDAYGTVVSLGTVTANFGIKDHSLARGSLLVGNNQGRSAELTVPAQNFSNVDIWALTWNPILGGTYAVMWRKLPAIVENPAQVIEIDPAQGIAVDKTDLQFPKVSLNPATIPTYDDATLQTSLQVLAFNPTTNQSYRLNANRLGGTDTGTTQLIKDTTPTLGGNLAMNGFKLTGMGSGIVLETTNGGNVSINGQVFPISKGVDKSLLTIDADGRMYWEPRTVASGVKMVRGEAGITTTPMTGIIDTGSVRLDYSLLPIAAPTPLDYIAFQNPVGMSKLRLDTLLMLNDSIAFVDPYMGKDENNRGSLTTPYRTLGYALDRVVADLNGIRKIILFPGTYAFPVTINQPNLEIASMFVSETVIIRNTVTINPGLGKTTFTNLRFDILEMLDDPLALCVKVPAGCDAVNFNGCDFTRFSDMYDRTLPVAKFDGNQLGDVFFNNCKINGKIINNLTPIEDQVEFGMFISNMITNNNRRLGLEVSGTSSTTATNVQVIDYVDHKGGYLELINIGQITGNYSTADLEELDDPDEDPADYGYIATGINSTAADNNDTALILNNVNSGISTPEGTLFTPIKKTGTAKFQFTNVTRDPSLDTLTGIRIRFASEIEVDRYNPYKPLPTSTGNVTLDINLSHTFRLNLTGNTTLSLTAPSAIDFDGWKEMVIHLTQDATGGRTVAFSTPIKWDNSSVQPAIATGANLETVYRFIYISGKWIGKREFIEVV